MDRYDLKHSDLYRIVIIVIIIIVVLLRFLFGVLFMLPTTLDLPADILVFTKGIFNV